MVKIRVPENLLDERTLSELRPKVAAILAKIEAIDETVLQSDKSHIQYRASFTDEHKVRRTLPSECDNLALLLYEYFGPFYDFEYVYDGTVRAVINLRYHPGPPGVNAMVDYLFRNLDNSEAGGVLPPVTFYVALSGSGVRAPLSLGDTEIVSYRSMKRALGLGEATLLRRAPSGASRLPGDVFAKVRVGCATQNRQIELFRERVEDGINLLRFWQHHLYGFDSIKNRPQIGTPPLAFGIAHLADRSVAEVTLYNPSVGGLAIEENEVEAMNKQGMSLTIEWQNAPKTSARYAITVAAKRLGHAWGLLSVEDRVLAAFRALEGLLLGGPDEAKSETLSRRMAALIENDPVSISKLRQELKTKLYYKVRSAVTHGGELRETHVQWVDGVVRDLSVRAFREAISMIAREPESSTVNDLRASLDTKCRANPSDAS